MLALPDWQRTRSQPSAQEASGLTGSLAATPPDNSRYLAEQIPGAQLLELLSVDHDPWVGALNDVLAALEGFVSAIGRDRLEPALPA